MNNKTTKTIILLLITRISLSQDPELEPITCEGATYYNNVTKTCDPCANYCSKCDSLEECTLCEKEAIICEKDCNKEDPECVCEERGVYESEYKTTNGLNCGVCSEHCLRCSSPSCSVCVSGYSLTENAGYSYCVKVTAFSFALICLGILFVVGCFGICVVGAWKKCKG